MLWSDALHVGTIANFDFYVCLRAKFHKQSFWVLILAAGGPYWVSISQKNGSLLGPYLKAKGSLIVLGTVHNGWMVCSEGAENHKNLNIAHVTPAFLPKSVRVSPALLQIWAHI